MTCVDGVFLMDFYQNTLVIVNLLPELHCRLVRVNLFQVTHSPAISPRYVEPIWSTATGNSSQFPNFRSF
jgi:hypothetical protein